MRVHSNPGDRVLDFFAGSGTTGEAAVNTGRHATLIDSRSQAIEAMMHRLEHASPHLHEELPAKPSRRKTPPRVATG